MSEPLTIGAIVAQYQRQVRLRESAAVERLTSAYGRMYGAFYDRATGLLEEARARGLSRAAFRRLDRYQRLLTDVEAQMLRYGAIVEDEIARAQLDALRAAARDAPGYTRRAMLFAGVPEPAVASIMATFRVMPDEAIEALAGALQERSPLQRLLAQRFGPDMAQEAGDILLRGLAEGVGPRRVAAELRRAFGQPLSDALRIARTETNRAFRAGTMGSWRLNPHIVRGWVWHAALDTRTCMSCVAMHGTEHGMDEDLDDHPNGRCAAIPITVSMAELGLDVPETQVEVEAGGAWFARQPEAVQRAMMGAAKYEAWRAGEIALPDLTARSSDPEWGTMRYEPSLKQIRGE